MVLGDLTTRVNDALARIEDTDAAMRAAKETAQKRKSVATTERDAYIKAADDVRQRAEIVFQAAVSRASEAYTAAVTEASGVVAQAQADHAKAVREAEPILREFRERTDRITGRG